MPDFGLSGCWRRLVCTRCIVTLLLLCALGATGVGCYGRSSADESSTPSPAASSGTPSTDLKVQLQTKLDERSKLKEELGAIQVSLAEATDRYNEAKRTSDTSADELEAKMQAKESERAKMSARLDALDSEIEMIAERYNSSQSSSESVRP